MVYPILHDPAKTQDILWDPARSLWEVLLGKTVDTTKEDDKKHDKFESIVQELVDEHGDNYTEAQLRVWARLIVNGLHSSANTPPNIPIITGEPAVKKRKIVQPKQDESFTDILKSAVSVFAE